MDMMNTIEMGMADMMEDRGIDSLDLELAIADSKATVTSGSPEIISELGGVWSMGIGIPYNPVHHYWVLPNGYSKYFDGESVELEPVVYLDQFGTYCINTIRLVTAILDVNTLDEFETYLVLQYWWQVRGKIMAEENIITGFSRHRSNETDSGDDDKKEEDGPVYPDV